MSKKLYKLNPTTKPQIKQGDITVVKDQEETIGTYKQIISEKEQKEMSTYLEENKLADSVAESTARLRSNTLLAYADNQS